MRPLLSPLQRRVLEAFFRLPASQDFVLTGGTALAAFYLFHRFSEDLALFTPKAEAMDETGRILEAISLEEGLTLEVERRLPLFVRAFFSAPGEPHPLKVDLAFDPGPWFGSPREVEGVRVDSLENIVANKVAALLSRGEVRDFIDLYFILRETSLRFDDLLEMARRKDPGLREFYLAGFVHQRMRRLGGIPPLRRELDLEEFRRFYEELAEALMRRARPGGPGADRPRSDPR